MSKIGKIICELCYEHNGELYISQANLLKCYQNDMVSARGYAKTLGILIK